MNGVVYIAFGEKAQEQAEQSICSMREAEVYLPVATVGDVAVHGTKFLPWTGKSPFCGDGAFSFHAGNVKPFLPKLSPFSNTLYLDSDTRIRKDFTSGFDYLVDYDVCVSYHVKKTGETWYVDEIFSDPKTSAPISNNSIIERNVTQGMIGEARMPFVNTGVIFFRKSRESREFFDTWHEEWEAFKDWDEQMAFHRAMCRCPQTRILLLPPIWNQKYENSDTIILHNMGKQSARKGVS